MDESVPSFPNLSLVSILTCMLDFIASVMLEKVLNRTTAKNSYGPVKMGYLARDSGLKSYHEFVQRIDIRTQKSKKHKKNVKKMLRFLAINGSCTTWDFGKNCFKSHNQKDAERMARRILEGRIDQQKTSPGLIVLGLINNEKGGKTYRLTFYGLLYSLKEIHFTKKELYQVADFHQNLLPYVFDKVDHLRRNNISLKPLRIIAQGNLSELQSSLQIPNPYQIFFLYLVSQHPIKGSTKKEFSNFVSYWFYAYLLWGINRIQKRGFNKRLKIILNEDEIKIWFCTFVHRALNFYEKINPINENFLRIVAAELRNP